MQAHVFRIELWLFKNTGSRILSRVMVIASLVPQMKRYVMKERGMPIKFIGNQGTC